MKASVHRMCGVSPNDLKLSDTPGWRGPCAAGGEGGGQEAGAVTAGRVRLQRMVRRCGSSENAS